jgi:hypothetical protein
MCFRRACDLNDHINRKHERRYKCNICTQPPSLPSQNRPRPSYSNPSKLQYTPTFCVP